MVFQDKSLQCCDCGNTFTFSAEDQEFFRSKGYTNEPKRCPHAVRQESQSVTGKAATSPDIRCSLPYALSAVRILKCPSNRAVTGRCTAVTATVKLNRVDKQRWTSSHIRVGQPTQI